MRRRQLFEIHDLEWTPPAIGESVVEVLGSVTRWAGIAAALAPIFRDFSARTAGAEVLDLCSGSGAAARLLLAALRAERAPAPLIVLTDLVPRISLWEALCATHEGGMTFIPSPVDATAVPAAVGSNRAWLIVNAFHHLDPRRARGLLIDACQRSCGIFIAENFDRRWLAAVPSGLYGGPAVLANPLLTPTRRLAKMLLTYVLPIIPAAVAWDGFVSLLRIYTRGELLAMTRDLDRFEWRFVSFQYRRLGLGSAFYGVPRAPAGA